jgi:hypothetical protein
VATFGKHRLVSDLRPEDFTELKRAFQKRYGLTRVNVCIAATRVMFRYGYESQLIPAPVVFGPTFKGASKKTMRLHRNAQGAKLFTPEEIRTMLAKATPIFKAMILLGTNAALGPADLTRLPLSAVDLDAGCQTGF